MAKAKSKTQGANITVPQSREEAADSIARIGVINREIARQQADLNDQIAIIKQAVDDAIQPQRDEAERLTQGLMTWAEANRRVLTNGDKTKTVDLGTGLLKWRIKPPKVTIRGVDAVIEAVKALGFAKKFLRTTVEINKEAMLADKEKARTIPGVTIGSEGEEFVVEPFEIELQGVA